MLQDEDQSSLTEASEVTKSDRNMRRYNINVNIESSELEK